MFQVSADAELGTTVHNLIAVDPDILNNDELKFDLAMDRQIKAVDKNGKEVRKLPNCIYGME